MDPEKKEGGVEGDGEKEISENNEKRQKWLEGRKTRQEEAKAGVTTPATAEAVAEKRTAEAREKKVEEIKNNLMEHNDKSLTKTGYDDTAIEAGDLVSEAMQKTGVDKAAQDFIDGKIPPSIIISEENIGEVNGVIEDLINKPCLIEAMKANGFGANPNPDKDPVIQARLKRMGAPAPVFEKVDSQEKLAWQVAALGEILEERGMTMKDRVNLLVNEPNFGQMLPKQILENVSAIVSDDIATKFETKGFSLKKALEIVNEDNNDEWEAITSVLAPKFPSGPDSNYGQVIGPLEKTIRETVIYTWAELAEGKLNAEILAAVPVNKTGIEAMFSKTDAENDTILDREAYDEFVTRIEEELSLKKGELFKEDGSLVAGIDAEHFRNATGVDLNKEQFNQLLQKNKALKNRIEVAGKITSSENDLELALADLGIDIKEFYEGREGAISNFEAWKKATPKERQALITDHLLLNFQTSVADKLPKKPKENVEPDSEAVKPAEAGKEEFKYSAEKVKGELNEHPIDAFRALLELRKLNRQSMVREIAKNVSASDIDTEIKKLNKQLVENSLTKREDESDEDFTTRLSLRRILQAQLTLLEDARALQIKDSIEASDKGYDLQDKLNKYGKKLEKSLDALDKLQAKGSPHTANLIRDILINGVSTESKRLIGEIKNKLTGKALGLLLLILLALLGPIAKELFNFK